MFTANSNGNNSMPRMAYTAVRNERSRERKFQGTNGPGNECSRERIVLRTNILDTLQRRETTGFGYRHDTFKSGYWTRSSIFIQLVTSPCYRLSELTQLSDDTRLGRHGMGYKRGVIRFPTQYTRRLEAVCSCTGHDHTLSRLDAFCLIMN